MKKQIINLTKTTLLTAALFALASAVPPAARADDGNPGIVPPSAGDIYAELSAAHWRWTYSFPVDQNPQFMDGPVDLSLGQPDGPVWFLGGSFVANPVPGGYPATANRTGTIPPLKALFFPIIDAECSVAEGIID